MIFVLFESLELRFCGKNYRIRLSKAEFGYRMRISVFFLNSGELLYMNI